MIQNVHSYLMPTYGDREIEFTRGEGAYLFSSKNTKYLDFGSGIAVNSLGHCHPSLVKALKDQSSKLWHTSNLYLNKNQEEYAELLCKHSFAEKVFFTNSGVESIECGLKVIRSFHYHHNNIEKKNIISFEGAFHGRTFAALSAQQNKKHFKVFEPLLPGFVQIPFNDLNAVKKTIDETTAAVMIETVQGEGGARPVKLKLLDEIKKICDQYKALLFLDEVQCGFGRSGKLFSYEWSNIEPDVMAVAKGIGSGFPMGACLATNKASVGMTKGMHGSTYGGNPLAVSVGKAVITEIMSDGFLQKVDNIAKYLWKKLKALENEFEEIIEIRGAGLLLGIKTKTNNQKICELLIKKGLLTVPANDNIVRLTPPLIVTNDEVDQAIEIINNVVKEIND
jgi:acetylornithine/N-succinyldiaminopimelate aminotransferase